MGAPARDDPVDEVLERLPLLAAVATPEGAKDPLAALRVLGAEEVLQTLGAVVGIALDVEEDVVARGLGKRREPRSSAGSTSS